MNIDLLHPENVERLLRHNMITKEQANILNKETLLNKYNHLIATDVVCKTTYISLKRTEDRRQR